jgi:nitrogen regulatory protein PII
METQELTLVTLVAERILRDRLLERIRELGARGYTLTDVTGEGTSHIHAHEWEGPSVKIETLVPEDVARGIVETAAKYFEHHAVIVYTQTVRVVRKEKF